MSSAPFPQPTRPLGELPLSFGVLLFPGFQALDAFGPLDALNSLAQHYPFTLSVIAPTRDPVSTQAPGALGAAYASASFAQTVVPTHTFTDAPPLDVLLVPGGVGTRDPALLDAAGAFIREKYPSLKYLITVCTGAALAARAGVLDGRRATTNKEVWARTVAQRPQVEWVPRARWVVDGNIWTAAGVSAGLDVVFAWMGEVYGPEVAERIANHLEYERHTDASWDPFAELNGL